MKIMILCQALLGFAALSAALPTPLQSTPTPDSLQQPPTDLPHSEVELLNSDRDPQAAQSDEDLRPLENPDNFEGDIIISPEEIELYYGKQNNANTGRPTRGVTRDRETRWPNGIIYYDFHSSILNQSSAHRRVIKNAIGIIEQETCLKFELRTYGDRIQFRNGSGCSSFIGRLGRGREQAVTLGRGCFSIGIVLHEILHALGVWHEQSRPDRDDYIRVITDNIKERYRFAFQKRNSYQIDYHGEEYDYKSVMHYGLSAFRNRSGLHTIEVANEAAYIWQGRPTIGQRKGLSDSDIIQLNRMYNCPGSGVPGNLQVLIKDATNLNTGVGNHRVYVLVTAVDDQGSNVTKTTNVTTTNDTTVTWNELIDFGGRISWQYMTISVWSVAEDGDSRITRSQAFSLSSGFHKDLLHCSNSRCNSIVHFDFNLKPDGNECSLNPCKNNGTCRDLISSFSCDCAVGYTGPQCRRTKGRLRIFVRNATDLPKRADGELVSPYINAIAYRNNDMKSRVSRFTNIVRGLSPQWNHNMDFGIGEWFQIKIKVIDWDWNRTPRGISLSKWNDYFIDSHTSQTSIKMEADSGYVLLDYHYEAE